MMLFVFAADDKPVFKRPAFLAPLIFCIALILTVSAYYGLHSIVFGTTVFQASLAESVTANNWRLDGANFKTIKIS
jgi:hypothetical protein